MGPDPRHKPGQDMQVTDATLRRFAGYAAKRAFNVLREDLLRALKPYDLRMLTYTALVLIVDNPGLSQSRLAAAMDVERPNLVVIIDDLENRDLIIRERVPSDRRAYALTPTLLGRRTCEKAIAAVKENEQRMLQNIGQDRITLAGDVMSQILEESKGG